MFLFVFKCHRNHSLPRALCYTILILGLCNLVWTCSDTGCNGNGVCKNGTCECSEGWQGPNCEFCGGKVGLTTASGTILSSVGNYSFSSRCTWFIQAPNASITFHLDKFVTECGWDHLYIYDGDSVQAPLSAVFSGASKTRRIPEVVAHSGSALVHFVSDDANTMPGFRISYRLNACPSRTPAVDCSGNGVCLDQVCICNKGWTGEACHLKQCPHNCGKHKGRGRCEESGCRCERDYKGSDCGQYVPKGYWEGVEVEGFVPPGSASHGALVWNDSMYVVGGNSYRDRFGFYEYRFKDNQWNAMKTSGSPSPRYGHSTVIHGDKIFLYGGSLGSGDITSEMWSFDMSAKTWKNITVKSCDFGILSCGPLASTGHTATVVKGVPDKMVILLGYSPQLGYLNTVQEFHFDTEDWRIVPTRGYSVRGAYGHSSTWDPSTNKIYVHGGTTINNVVNVLSKSLYSYDPSSRVWMQLAEAPSGRYLHTATLISSGLMLVFGGNVEDTALQRSKAKCYSSKLLAYDIPCDSWHVLPVPKGVRVDLARFGHSAVAFEGSLYIYGGFDGQMLSNLVKYTAGDCMFTTLGGCLSRNTSNIRCPQSITHSKKRCDRLTDCLSCVRSRDECVWCGNACMKTCKNSSDKVATLEQCPPDSTTICSQLHTCPACTLQSFCRWDLEHAKCLSTHLPLNTFFVATAPNHCPKPCSVHNSCTTCTTDDCIWCQDHSRCIHRSSYLTSFPYGQCRAWASYESKCHSIAQCGVYSTCVKCREDPACGWCDNGSKTGVGKCMSGGYRGPESLSCPSDRWYFTTCPLCQCNGHSSCLEGTNMCLPCRDLTMGNQCESCQEGLWGDATNGGECHTCQCNARTKNYCDPSSGKCFCTTKGIVGDHCEECDEYNHYSSDPVNKECYYELFPNYQFTFNFSKKSDRHFKQINLRNAPTEHDLDVDFSFKCSQSAKVNVTFRSGNSDNEKSIFEDLNCNASTTHFAFSRSEYRFGMKGNVTLTTFFVYVYEFHPPLWIQVSFAQHPRLRLPFSISHILGVKFSDDVLEF